MDEASHVLLSNRYEFTPSQTNELGEGAFGYVYRGLDLETKNAVAIKQIDVKSIKLQELSLLKRADSMNIVKTLAICSSPQHKHMCFVVMELCDSDLATHLAQFGDIEEIKYQNIDRVAQDLARGYHALYKLNIIHRDIKPQNVMVIYEKEPARPDLIKCAKLTDFSASRIASEVVEMSNLAGTPLYMAPEVGANVVDEREYDAKVDMWSIGILLFECLSGQVPFQEADLCKLFLHSANKNYDGYTPPVFPELSHIPQKYQFLINRLLQIDPEKRLTAPQFLAVMEKIFCRPHNVDSVGFPQEEITVELFNKIIPEAKTVYRVKNGSVTFANGVHKNGQTVMTRCKRSFSVSETRNAPELVHDDKSRFLSHVKRVVVGSIGLMFCAVAISKVKQYFTNSSTISRL